MKSNPVGAPREQKTINITIKQQEISTGTVWEPMKPKFNNNTNLNNNSSAKKVIGRRRGTVELA